MEHCKVCGLPTFTDASSVNCEGPCGNSLRTCLNCYARDSSECEPPPQKVAKLVAVGQLTLPSELWTEVFGSLSAWDLLKVRLVCHRWRKLVNGSSTLRRKLVVQFPEFIMMDRDYAPSNLPPASVVMFSRAKIATVGSWWTSFGAGVVHLTMNRCNVLLPNMLSLLKLTPNLKELHLSDILIDTLDEAPAMADFRMEQMELLHIDLNYHGQNLGVFLELCPNLKDLALLCELYSDEFKNLLQQLPSYLRKISATLESLQVIKTEHLLAELCCLDLPKLKRLHLNKCESRCKNNRALVEICRTHPTLEVLDIEDVSASNEMVSKDTHLSISLTQHLPFSHPDSTRSRRTFAEPEMARGQGTESARNSTVAGVHTTATTPATQRLHLPLSGAHVRQQLPIPAGTTPGTGHLPGTGQPPALPSPLAERPRAAPRGVQAWVLVLSADGHPNPEATAPADAAVFNSRRCRPVLHRLLGQSHHARVDRVQGAPADDGRAVYDGRGQLEAAHDGWAE